MTALVVVDADVLGRERTGDETYVRNLLRELGLGPGDEVIVPDVTDVTCAMPSPRPAP